MGFDRALTLVAASVTKMLSLSCLAMNPARKYPMCRWVDAE
jgi:hypothetical protein